MLTCKLSHNSPGSVIPLSLSSLIRTNASVSTPSCRCLLYARCSATVDEHDLSLSAPG